MAFIKLPPSLGFSQTPPFITSGYTGPSGSAATPTGAAPYTPASWAAQVLHDAGLPVVQQNITDIEHWITTENHPATWWIRGNPLNTTRGASPTATPQGIVAPGFANLTIGATETAKTITQSNMAAIFNALKSGTTSATTFGKAAGSTPWAASHYAGVTFGKSAMPTGKAPTVEGTLTRKTLADWFKASGTQITTPYSLNAIGTALGTTVNKDLGVVKSAVSFATDPLGYLSGNPIFIRGVLIMVGIILLLIGVNRMLSGGKDSNPVSVVVEGGKDVGKKAGNVAKASGEAVAA